MAFKQLFEVKLNLKVNLPPEHSCKAQWAPAKIHRPTVFEANNVCWVGWGGLTDFDLKGRRKRRKRELSLP